MRVKVALIQHRAIDVEHADEALAKGLDMIEAACTRNPDLVVLPECSYPGYYLGLNGDPHGAASGFLTAMEAYCDAAKRHSCHLVVGIAEVDDNRLFNSAYLIDPAGDILGKARKTFLWQFDGKWFEQGDDLPVFDTALGKIGILVCADGRTPEISRVLALGGANIIVDSTNWVTTGRDPRRLANPQPEFIIPTRAYENGVWFLCANKVGAEAETVVYCGRSTVISPIGEVLAEASSDAEEIVHFSFDVDATPRLSRLNLRQKHASQDWRLLAEPNENVPLASLIDQPVSPSRNTTLLAVAQTPEETSFQDFSSWVEVLVPRLAQQGADLAVFPLIESVSRSGSTEVLERMKELAKRHRIVLTLGPNARPTAHGNSDEDMPSGILELNNLKIGFVTDAEMEVPEIPRTLFLKGTDCIVWQKSHAHPMDRCVALTRAAENRVYVVMATPEYSLIASPDGRVLAETFPGKRQAVMALASPAISRVKELTRGTNVLTGRTPKLYGRLALPK